MSTTYQTLLPGAKVPQPVTLGEPCRAFIVHARGTVHRHDGSLDTHHEGLATMPRRAWVSSKQAQAYHLLRCNECWSEREWSHFVTGLGS